MVVIDRILDDVVPAEDDIMAIDRALEGQGEEGTSKTRDVYVSTYQG